MAAAKCICENNTPPVAEQKLEKALTTSAVLCNESIEVRAILHTVVKHAVARWQQCEEPPAPRDGLNTGAGTQNTGGGADAPGGHTAEAGAGTGGGGASRTGGADEDNGLLA
ncbi:hypothetical protein KFL_012890010, partial [Klebsormidium nitens]